MKFKFVKLNEYFKNWGWMFGAAFGVAKQGVMGTLSALVALPFCILMCLIGVRPDGK